MKKVRLCSRNDNCHWHGLVMSVDRSTQEQMEGKPCTSCEAMVGFIDAEEKDRVGSRKQTKIRGKEVLKK